MFSQKVMNYDKNWIDFIPETKKQPYSTYAINHYFVVQSLYVDPYFSQETDNNSMTCKQKSRIAVNQNL